MNSIGKISKRDWSKAPEDAQYVNLAANYAPLWYKIGDDAGLKFLTSTDYWDSSAYSLQEEAKHFKLISREEDLGMNKQVKTTADLEVGMFLKNNDSTTVRLVTKIGQGWFVTFNVNSSVTTKWVSLVDDDFFTKWSYTYSGGDNPIIKETAKEKAIKAAKEEITQAQKNLDNAKRKLDEALSQE